MNLYALTRVEPYEEIYDAYEGFVICANDEVDARNVAAGISRQQDSQEDPEIWLSSETSLCLEIGVAEPTIERGAILCDYHWG